MLERSTSLRLAAVATVFALAVPVWATEIQMKKKEDPQAQKQAAQKETEGAKAPKKNCPTDNAFNTLEDLFGQVGPLDLLALPEQQAAQSAATPAGQPAAATAAVEWRVVAPPAEPEKAKQPAKKN